MTEYEIVRRAAAILARTGIGYGEGAALAHVSPATLRHTLAVGKLPTRHGARRAIEQFVSLNAQAAARGDLRMVP